MLGLIAARLLSPERGPPMEPERTHGVIARGVHPDDDARGLAGGSPRPLPSPELQYLAKSLTTERDV